MQYLNASTKLQQIIKLAQYYQFLIFNYFNNHNANSRKDVFNSISRKKIERFNSTSLIVSRSFRIGFVRYNKLHFIKISKFCV